MERYSKKREAILSYLRGTKSHPTAECIYVQLKKEFPNLSLATVYRNLSQLKESGLIRSVGVILGEEHFDATCVSHTHLICEKCGCVIDVEEIQVPDILSEKAASATGFEILNSDLKFYGICSKCRCTDIEENV